MNKSELTAKLAERVGGSHGEAEKALNSLIELVTETLKKGEDVNITGFGAFTVSHRAARMGINPQTGERVQIAASKAPKFKAGKGFKDAIKG